MSHVTRRGTSNRFISLRDLCQPVPGVQKSADGQRSLNDVNHLEDPLQNYLVCIEWSL